MYYIIFRNNSFILSRIYIKTTMTKMSDKKDLSRKKLYINFLFSFLGFPFD